MTHAVKNGDMLTDGMLSDQIHTKLREIAGQQTAAGIIDRLRHQGVRYQSTCRCCPHRLAEGAREHLDIIDAVISGDRWRPSGSPASTSPASSAACTSWRSGGPILDPAALPGPARHCRESAMLLFLRNARITRASVN